MTNSNPSMIDAARQFGQSLPSAKHADGQEALRFARWFGEDRVATEIRPVDLELYVETFGATTANSMARGEALKGFLAYCHKQNILPSRMVSHVRVRRPSVRRGAKPGEQREVRVTTEGRLALEQELETLKAERPRIAMDLREARADGDVRENAPLDAAREAQGQLEARIRELEAMLRLAVVVDDNGEQVKNDSARIGCNVTLANLMTGAQLSYQLVNAAEARPGSGRLSVESPVGQAVVGKRVGEEIQVAAPSGTVRFRIEAIQV